MAILGAQYIRLGHFLGHFWPFLPGTPAKYKKITLFGINSPTWQADNFLKPMPQLTTNVLWYLCVLNQSIIKERQKNSEGFFMIIITTRTWRMFLKQKRCLTHCAILFDKRVSSFSRIETETWQFPVNFIVKLPFLASLQFPQQGFTKYFCVSNWNETKRIGRTKKRLRYLFYASFLKWLLKI